MPVPRGSQRRLNPSRPAAYDQDLFGIGHKKRNFTRRILMKGGALKQFQSAMKVQSVKLLYTINA